MTVLPSKPFPNSDLLDLYVPPHLKAETGPVSEMLCSLDFKIPDDGQSPKIQ
jgi:hypothetical protein